MLPLLSLFPHAIFQLHGNELAGIPVIHRIFSELDVENLSGTLVAVPVVNVIGFLRFQRGFGDGADLNRIMPGKKGGSASQSYAAALISKIIRHVDYLLDLHTASFGRVNSLYVRADMTHPTTHRLALLQCPQIVVHNSGIDGSLRGACAALGKPCVTVEIGDPQVIDPIKTNAALAGVRNTLLFFKMVEVGGEAGEGGGGSGSGSGGSSSSGAATATITAPPPVIVSRSFWVFSTCGGILTVKPAVAEWVKRGQVIAEVHSIWGELVDTVCSSHDGIIVGKSTNPVCATGDRILHLGVCEHSFPAKASDGHE